MTYDLATLGWTSYFARQLGPDDDALTPARVTAVHRAAVTLLTPAGEQTIPPFGEDETAPATGDWVLLNPDGSLNRLMDRRGAIKRRAAGPEARVQLIAANIDTLFIVTSCNADFNVARLERYLALALEAGAIPVIVLTKVDLADDPAPFLRDANRLMPDIMVEVLNAKDAEDVERLRPWCGPGQTVAFMGSSGVGKSTLVNGLLGEERVETQAIREADAKGRHTTTARALHRLPSGGWLLDTPGMREIQLTDVAEGIGEVFADLSDLAEQCRFNDCAHETEPGCAVRAAVDAGEIEESRFRRWLKLTEEDARNTVTTAERRKRERTLQKVYKSGQKRGRQKRRLDEE
ncbi:ribosome small subunit-dependent GTPase A [Oceanibium sediminis]|uniref:ribosome small subunit-dependent GTPase A n=1 Tax=Oceanibium sediminis TaxID=2026339 RepID=UPI000DD455B8|nr:ribosome small subunit-dependent GTPase A [Oceanibium sediminis]